MKNLFLVSILAMAIGVNAQIESGKIMVGGSLGLSTSGGASEEINSGTSETTDLDKRFSFSIVPQAHYFLSENLSVGMGIGYSFTRYTNINYFVNGTDKFDQVIKTSLVLFLPQARYYKSLGKKFYLFGEVGIPVMIGSQSQLKWNDTGDGVIEDDSVNKVSGLGFDLSLGLDYAISDHFVLEAGLGLLNMSYSNVKSTDTDKDGKNGEITKETNFNFSVNTDNLLNLGSLTIGVKYIL